MSPSFRHKSTNSLFWTLAESDALLGLVCLKKNSCLRSSRLAYNIQAAQRLRLKRFETLKSETSTLRPQTSILKNWIQKPSSPDAAFVVSGARFASEQESLRYQNSASLHHSRKALQEKKTNLQGPAWVSLLHPSILASLGSPFNEPSLSLGNRN